MDAGKGEPTKPAKPPACLAGFFKYKYIPSLIPCHLRFKVLGLDCLKSFYGAIGPNWQFHFACF
jgi:hypothetical protein